MPTLIFNPSGLDLSDRDAENSDPSHQIEFDEELLLETILSAIIAHLISSKFRPLNLDFQPVCLAPAFPPPKYA